MFLMICVSVSKTPRPQQNEVLVRGGFSLPGGSAALVQALLKAPGPAVALQQPIAEAPGMHDNA